MSKSPCLINRASSSGRTYCTGFYHGQMPGRDADVISSGRDPDRPPRWPAVTRRRRWPWPGGRWPWLAAAVLAAAGLVAGLTAGLSGRPPRLRPAAARPLAHAAGPPATLAGHPAPGLPRGTVLLLAGTGLQVITAADRAPVTPGWAQVLLTRPGPSPPGPDPAVQFLQAVPGGFVALLGDSADTGYPDLGTVFFIPVTARGLAAPRFLGRASAAAVAPGGRDVWLQRAGPRGGGATWLTGRSGRRLSPVLRLGGQVLLADTVRGLLAGTARGGVRIIGTPPGRGSPGGPASPGGAAGPGGPLLPPGALVAAVSATQVAWQAPRCPHLACPLHVTDLRTGASRVIALPPGTETDGQPGAFDPAGRRIALPLDTTNRAHLPVTTWVYLADIAARRIAPLPGAALPLTSAPSDRGAIAAAVGTISTLAADVADAVSWAGSALWVLTIDQSGFQAAYWPGTGPLRLLPPQPGQVSLFAAGPVY
jgi:hypothetical protein